MRDRGKRVYKTKPICTPGGRWLDAIIVTYWGSRLRFLEETRCVAEKTLDNLLYRPEYRPETATLRRLAEAIARKQQDRGDTPVNERAVRAKWTTREEARRDAASSLPRCPICGERRKADKATCSPLCATLRAFLHPKLLIRTLGGKRLWAVCAASADVRASRIAALLEIPLKTVHAWLDTPAVREFLVRIRQERGSSLALLQPVARIFTMKWGARLVPMSVDTLRRYLTGVYRLPNKKNRVRLHHARYLPSIAERLGMSVPECAEAFGVDLFKAYARDRIRQLQPTRWHPRLSRGRPVSSCVLNRRIHDLRLQGKPDKEIADVLAEQGEIILTPKEVYWLPIQHARRCERCRPGVAFDLHARGNTIRRIATLLHIGKDVVARDIQRGQEQARVFAHGALTVTQAAHRLHLTPRKVRELADSGYIPVTRTSGGWRLFNPRALETTRVQDTSPPQPFVL